MSPWKVAGLIVAAAVVVAQLVPVERENPPVTAEVAAPAEVGALLRRACYDCHSHETEWPMYSYVAPVSWMVAGDVEQARRNVNFSTWGEQSSEDMADAAGEIAEEVGEDEMPLPRYLVMHAEARLDGAEGEAIVAWAEALERELRAAGEDGS